MEIRVDLEIVSDLRDEHRLDDVFDNFYDCTGYICDAISEIADSNVSIYNSDLWDWARDNEEYVEQAVNEFGIDSKDFDLIRLFQQGQYLYNSEYMYEHLDEMILFYAYNYICEELSIEEITSDEKEELEELLGEIDNNNQIEDIIEKINEVLGGKE